MCDTSKGPKDMEDLVEPRGFQEHHHDIYVEIVDKLVKRYDAGEPCDRKNIESFFHIIKKKYHINFAFSEILHTYRLIHKEKGWEYNREFEEILQTKTHRSESGITEITVVTTPYPHGQPFSCEYDCKMCPKEPDQPRSYLKEEPAVARANRLEFDAVRQFRERANTHVINGHPYDKVELIVLGGTWSSYPESFQEEFIRDLYYAANTYCDSNDIDKLRPRLSLDEEIKLNEDSLCRIIGLTLETRPDRINPRELQRFRRFGCTRVQIGVQHTNDRVLERIDRRCKDAHTRNAIKLLKNNGFKVDIHLMPDLPQPYKIGVDPHSKTHTIDDIDTDVDMCDEDKNMFDTVMFGTEHQADQWKIYPNEVVPWTDNKIDYENGLYKPYGEQVKREFNRMHELLIYVKTNVPPWVRLNRVIRDIPNFYISGGVKDVGMRQTLQIEMAKRGLECKCIRCREVKKRKIDHSLAVLTERIYESSGGTEYYISFETADKKILFGFLRLRLCDRAGMPNTGDVPVFPELIGSALIRELHVYGQTIPVRRINDTTECSQAKHQHVGFGTRLVRRAFEIAQEKGFEKIAVISGVGVKNYYKRFGFEDENMFMTYVFPKAEPAQTHKIIRASIDDKIETIEQKIYEFVKHYILFVLNYDVVFFIFLLWYCFYLNY